MLKRLHTIAFVAAAFAVPAFADGKGQGPTYNAPAPLVAQSYTQYTHTAPVPHSTYQHTTCNSTCGQTSGTSYSGLPTNPQQNCCGHAPAVVYHAPAPVHHAPAPIVHTAAPVMSVRAGDVVGLDGSTIASFNGGVGTGVNDVFVGGGFGAGFGGSSFGLRSSGFFAGRNAAFQRSFSGFRGNRGGGFRGGRGGGFRGGRGGGGRRGGK